MEAVKEFISKLLNEYVTWTLIGIIGLILIIFFVIVLYVKNKRASQEKSKQDFKQNSLQSLTPEEIDNISNNSANPEEVKEYLNAEVEEVKSINKKPKAKQSSDKVKSQPAKPVEKSSTDKKEPSKAVTKNSTPAKKQVKEEVKVEDKPLTQPVKAVESKPVSQPKKEVKKAEVKKTEVKPENKPKKQEVKVEDKPFTQPVKEVKKASSKTENKTSNQAKTTPQKEETKRQYAGKWKISQDEEGFFATLTASNGGTLLITEKYKSLAGVKSGIETIKKNVDGGNFSISVDKYGHYRFKLLNLSNRLICVSEDYSSKNKCENGIESVKRFAKTDNIIIEEK